MEAPNRSDYIWVFFPTHLTHPALGWVCRNWSWQWVQVESFPSPAWLFLCIGRQILAVESADPSVVAVSFVAKQVRKADSWFQLDSGGPGRNDYVDFSMARKHWLLSVDQMRENFKNIWKVKVENTEF